MRRRHQFQRPIGRRAITPRPVRAGAEIDRGRRHPAGITAQPLHHIENAPVTRTLPQQRERGEADLATSRAAHL